MGKRRKRRLADDIRESLYEALDDVRGKRTGAIVHRVTPCPSVQVQMPQKLSGYPVRRATCGGRRSEGIPVQVKENNSETS